MRRRTLLSAFSASVAGLAGCTSPGGTEPMTDERETTETTSDPDEPTTAGEPSTSTTTDGRASDGDGGDRDTATTDGDTVGTDLDRREANVMAVEFEQPGSDHRFSVTLYHDDAGEDGYANWWVIEALDGSELGRRKLLHAHGTQEFTRSETITIPEGTACVVVRGHDQTHGYGGRAMLVNLDTGATRTVNQGAEPRSFADADC
ncbi:hypothetical protein C440_11598 [Haloferax mucosum ATCC BAA-1512]|uniref:Lipoprotein n=1 Tax=Haloferax mucosum ATCC BAA-1512 TaxID=662479 RepID=M0IEI6_9EURY|nr:hypothetical protein [Haloferax mucosum]ELZ94263.1 hypothetical protein C440_11598 [Haloferax mucosum ATCC BAA-1512]